jgi:hypothetical protein
MMMPVQLEMTDLTKPCWPPPQAKNDAQAMNETQTGTGKAVAVSTPPRKPKLIIDAEAGAWRSPVRVVSEIAMMRGHAP